MIRVVPHQSRKIERHREPGLTLFQKVAVARVGLLGGGKSGELPHGPEAASVHGVKIDEMFWTTKLQLLDVLRNLINPS